MRYFKTSFFVGIILFAVTVQLFANGGGDDHGVQATGVNVMGSKIRLTEAGKANIGLKLTQADIRTIEKVVQLNGVIKPHPNKLGLVTSRIPGKIVKLYANLGDVVEKDAPLADLESRQVGNPPPVITLPASLTGTIIHRDVVLGQTVEPEQHLFEIADLSTLIVEGDLYEEDIADLSVGQIARVRLPVAYPQEVIEGKISFISAELDPVERSVHIWVELANSDGRLKPGMLARVAAVVKAVKEAVAVPKEAILEDAGQKYVYLQDGDLFVRQEVVVGLTNDQYAEVIEGLFPADKVVTQGNYELRMVELTARPAPSGNTKKEKKGH